MNDRRCRLAPTDVVRPATIPNAIDTVLTHSAGTDAVPYHLHLAVRTLLSPTILSVLNQSLHCHSVSARDTTLERSHNTCSAHREIAQHLLRYHVVIVLRFLGLIDVCCGVGEQPTAFQTEVGTGVLWVLTRTHPCDDRPRQDGEPAERQLVLACLLVRWLFVVTDCGD